MWIFWLHPLRGLAALGIVFLHSYWTWHYFDSSTLRKFYLFVDFFFVLSGFVISSGYSERLNTIDGTILFFRQRFRRLSFQFYLSGAVWLATGLAVAKYGFDTNSLYAALRYFFFVDIFFEEGQNRVNPVAWSVMTELWVYFFFGAVALLIQDRFRRATLFLLIAVAGAITLGETRGDLNILYGIDSVIRSGAGFFFGSFCWYIFSSIRSSPFTGFVFAVALAAVSGVALVSENLDILSIPAAGFIIFIFASLSEPRNGAIRSFLYWLGDISYPLYLWHFIAGVAIAKIIEKYHPGDPTYFNGEKFATLPPDTGFFYCVVLIVSSVTLSVLSLKLERRFKKVSK